MTAAAAQARDPLGVWCGWVLAVAAALTPLLAWLGPLAFAPLLALVGLLCLPAVRIGPREAPLAAVLVGVAAWAALSSLWSPSRPTELGDSVALKLALQIPLYWSAWCGARRADPALRRLTLRILAWGLTAYGVLLFVEAVTGAGVYRALRDAMHDPIRPDLGRKNVAHGAFALALLWPVALAGGVRAGAPAWLALPLVVGLGLVASRFDADAPVLSIGLAAAVGGLVLARPRAAPRWLGAGAAGLALFMPLLILGAHRLGLGQHLPLSWELRVGYWNYAIERIGEHPWRGWGLDASRTFSPHIQLHPHNGSIQLWLELGALGAVAAALVWVFAFRRMTREEASLAAAGTAASAAIYLLFGTVSFGVWQEWWLALGAYVAVIAALADRQEGAA